jgi:formate C-acetyltransferase
MYLGYAEHFDSPVPIARAYAQKSLFSGHEKYIYKNDLIAGSVRGKLIDSSLLSGTEAARADFIVRSYGRNNFHTNADHYAPDYYTFLSDGVGETLEKIRRSLAEHARDPDSEKKTVFLKACEISVSAFSEMIIGYAEKARELAEGADSTKDRERFSEITQICEKISFSKPESFREALQLIWLAHVAFSYEERFAMAFGRMDQYLYPYYAEDIKRGVLTEDFALELLESTLIKIGEARYFGGDDVVNIAIAGLKPDGSGGVNELSYLILHAVKNCNIPGPNLSARVYEGIPDKFLDACLEVIGTGLGYPALMNDSVNIPALARHGYSLWDSRNYCMVGCIENFIQGKQPPWSDDRFNTPKYLELALNNGVCMLSGARLGPETGEPGEFKSMDDLISAFLKQMERGAAEYMARFRNENERYNKTAYSQPFLSCFCRDCVERGLDINDGGAVYPSVHGAGCMGIATVADSLAAIRTLFSQSIQ